MRRRRAAFGLAVILLLYIAVNIVTEGEAEAKAKPASSWREAVQAGAAKDPGLEVYRTLIQQRSKEVTAANAASRTEAPRPGQPRAEDATLEGDAATLLRLPAANLHLDAAREDLAAATRDAEKQAAFALSSFLAASERSAIWKETATHLLQAKEWTASRHRFGLADDDELLTITESYAKAAEEAAAAEEEAEEMRRILEDAYGSAGLVSFDARNVFTDIAIETAQADTLVRAALSSDPTLRKLQGMRRFEEQRFTIILSLYGSFFGAEAALPLELVLNEEPVDYKLMMAVYNVFITEVTKQDATASSPPMKGYLGEQPYALPAAFLSRALAMGQERERMKALTDQINGMFVLAVKEQTAMRQAVRVEADRGSALQKATSMQKAGMAQPSAVIEARGAYGRARLEAVQAKDAYFHAVMELHYATGGALAKRLDGDMLSPIGEPAERNIGEGAQPELLVAIDASLQAELSAIAEAAATAADDLLELLVIERSQLAAALALATAADAKKVAAMMEERLAVNAVALSSTLGVPDSSAERIRKASPPRMIDSEMYVPIRAYAEALGFRVTWNGQEHAVRLHGEGGNVFQVRMSATAVFHPDFVTELSKPPVMAEGHIFVPLSFFTDVLDIGGTKVERSEDER